MDHNNVATRCRLVRNEYRKRGKICWAKHLQCQAYEVFRGNTFTVPWPAVFII